MQHAHKHFKHLMLAGVLAALGLAAAAQTASPAPGTGAPPAAMRDGAGRMDSSRMHERMQKRMERRLGELKQKLQISPAQEGIWGAYVAALKPSNAQRPQRPDRAELARLTTPERIDRMRAMRSTRMAEMDKRGDATKTFYAALAPEQKKVFDEQSLRRGHGEQGGRGHHGWHHKG